MHISVQNLQFHQVFCVDFNVIPQNVCQKPVDCEYLPLLLLKTFLGKTSTNYDQITVWPNVIIIIKWSPRNITSSFPRITGQPVAVTEFFKF